MTPAARGFLYNAPMKSIERNRPANPPPRQSIVRNCWLVPALLFSLAGCGLKGPLYLPDDKQQEVPASTPPAKGAVLEGSRVRTLPPAPQSQKKDRERANQSTSPSESTAPLQSNPPPVSPPDPDRPATTPPGQ
jgi:predicted small lipoprotein YifL